MKIANQPQGRLHRIIGRISSENITNELGLTPMKITKSFLWYGLLAVVMAWASSAEAQQVHRRARLARRDHDH